MRLLLVIFSLLSISAFGASDLELRKASPLVESNGEILHVQLSISNRGPAISERPRCRLTLYSGQQIVDSAMYQFQPVNSGELRDETLDWKITTTVANSLAVELFDELQTDEYPSNNFLKVELHFPGQNKIDLELADVTFPTEQKMEGKTAEFRVLVRNRGPLESKTSVIKLNLVQFQQTITSAVKKLGLLVPGEEKEMKIVMRLPSEGISVEQVLFEARCENRDPSVEESDSTNNILSKPMLLSIRMPDLSVKDMRVDNRGNLAFWVMNRGTARSLPTITAFYVNGALVRRFNTPELAAGKSRRHVYGGMKVPAGTQVTVVADFNADLAESSKENNRLNFTVPSR
jgi:subtilase family serine protease